MLGLRYLAVAGSSMTPTLHEGDWVLARRASRVGVGDVVVLEHPRRAGLLIVKRVAEVRPGGYYLLGDAPDRSTDSRHFGPVRAVYGPVVWRIRPWGPVGAPRAVDAAGPRSARRSAWAWVQARAAIALAVEWVRARARRAVEAVAGAPSALQMLWQDRRHVRCERCRLQLR